MSGGRRTRGRELLALAVALTLTLAAAPPPARAAAASLERATDAVVAITVGGEPIGSGIIVAEARVLTAAHVVVPYLSLRPVPLRVWAADTEVPFEVLALDRDRDLALLAADLPAGLAPIAWGSSDALTRGEDVIVLGFPIGLSSVSLTKGVVSSPEQPYLGSVYVQTDAAINPGNSGGALVDADGRLVGVNVAKIADVQVDAVGFSIPSDDARAFVLAAEPGIDLTLDLAPRARASGGVVWWALGTAVVLLAAGGVARQRTRARGAAARAAAGAGDADEAPPTVTRWRFSVRDAGGLREDLIRLPGVVGTAANADLRVTDAAVTPYHARLVQAGEGVEVVDLTDEQGLYCAEKCVPRAIIRAGGSVRVGATTVTFLGTEQVARP